MDSVDRKNEDRKPAASAPGTQGIKSEDEGKRRSKRRCTRRIAAPAEDGERKPRSGVAGVATNAAVAGAPVEDGERKMRSSVARVATNAATAGAPVEDGERKTRSSVARVATDAAAAGGPVAAAGAGLENNDVEIERESSAWDVLGQQFQQAAAAGNYIDLSHEEQPKTLSESDAAQLHETRTREEAGRASVPQAIPPLQQEETAQSPLEMQLGRLVTKTVNALKRCREKLAPIAVGSVGREKAFSSVALLKKINNCTKRIQKFVNQHKRQVADSDAIMQRLQELNLLVSKANVLIHQINRMEVDLDYEDE